MIKNISDIEKALKLADGSLSTALTATEEVVVEIPKLKIYTEEEEAARLENIRLDAKQAGVEIAVKDARTKLGLSFEGKTLDNLLDNFSKKILSDANIQPDKKVAELTSDLEKIRTNYSSLENQFNNFKQEVGRREQQFEIDNNILSKIPQNTVIEKSDVLNIFKSKIQVEKDDKGNLIFKKNGEILKNQTTLNPLSVDEVVTDFVYPYLAKPSGGSGAGDDKLGGKVGSLEAFNKEMNDKGVVEGSLAYNEEISLRIKNKTLTF